LALIFTAFFMMTLVGYLSLRTIMQNQIAEMARGALRVAEANIHASLREPEVILFNASYNVTEMAESGAGREDFARFFRGMTDWLMSDVNRWRVYRGVYGVMRGEFIDGARWEPPADYVFAERPWHVAAREKNGDVAITTPYRDARVSRTDNQGRMLISMSREIHGPGRERIGVIAVDMYLEQFFRNAGALSAVEDGYGMIVSDAFDVIAHHDMSLVNRPLTDISEDYAGITEDLMAGREISGRTIVSGDGVTRVVFFRRIYNGWYVATATPMSSFYRDVDAAAARLSVLGAAIFVVLSCMLLRLSAGKLRSDEESKGKTNFLARVSHEIRTPMNAIIGRSELALQAEDAGSVRDCVSNIRQSGQNVLSIINEMLDFAKIESDGVDVSPAPYRLSALMNDVVSATRPRIAERPVVFSVNVDCGLPDNLVGDAARIRQVLTNLLSNAAKYTYEGHISLNVFGSRMDDRNILMSFEVEDSGIGIEKQELDGLFGHFARRGNGVEGAGPGLAMTKNLCNAMGGDVNVFSVYGKGSIFTAAIPQVVVDGESVASVANAETKRVILYDDRPVYAESVVKTLRNLGVPTTVAPGVEDFMRELSTDVYRCAFVCHSVADDAISLKRSKGLGADIVVLGGVGDVESREDAEVIMMPAFAVQIANALNGAPESNRELGSERFVSPDSSVLVVDDNLTNLNVTHGLLMPYKMRVDLCDSGESAVARARTTRYDLIFMDHMMPGMDGVEAAESIRSTEFGRDVPIIALTANAVPGMREMFLENGMNDFISKPIDSARLEALLREWLPEDKRLFTDADEIGEPDGGAATIDGMDVEAALRNLGGNKKVLLQVLRTFSSHTSTLMERIISPAAENLADYAIVVHGIKGSCYSICAEELATRAEELERASKAGDLALVISKNDGFISALRRFIAELDNFLSGADDGPDKEIKPAPDVVDLANILEACANYDAIEIERALANMERYAYETGGELVRWIREQFDNLEYDAIVEKLKNNI
jgi:signal transduction histidine kinase/CheY-like chemotaxis protein